MRLDDTAGNSQPQASSAVVAPPRGCASPTGVEYQRKAGVWNAALPSRRMIIASLKTSLQPELLRTAHA
jgi:hypothetical protein